MRRRLWTRGGHENWIGVSLLVGGQGERGGDGECLFHVPVTHSFTHSLTPATAVASTAT